MSTSTRRIRAPIAIALGFAVSGGVAAWYMQFSPAGLLGWAAFVAAGLALAALVGRMPS